MLLWRLVLALFISDFVLQFNWIIKHKHQAKGIMLHGLVYLLVSLALIIDIISPDIFWLIFVLTVIHIFTDILKEKLSQCYDSLQWIWFLSDQLIHVITIIIGVSLISDSELRYILLSKNKFEGDIIIKYLVLLIVNLLAGKYFTKYITHKYQPDNRESEDDSHAVIGIFERFLITLSVLIGRYEIIGFLIAAKSIIRLPEARTLDGQSDEKSRKMVNYYLIGTFASYSWAIAFSLLFITWIR